MACARSSLAREIPPESEDMAAAGLDNDKPRTVCKAGADTCALLRTHVCSVVCYVICLCTCLISTIHEG